MAFAGFVRGLLRALLVLVLGVGAGEPSAAPAHEPPPLATSAPAADSGSARVDSSSAPAAAANVPRMPERDRVRLAEAFRLAQAIQDRVWPEWSSAPFAVLLVTPETEFLVRHPAPGSDFSAGEYDSLLRSLVYWRRRVLPVSFQATFPAVGGISTIVIGEAESVHPAENSTRWVLTVMHEHFHQWQETRSGYQAAVDSLKLARGDQTGMWMLNFPFPYSDPRIAARFEALCRMRARALRARGAHHFAAHFDSCAAARRQFDTSLAPDDARYLEFQLWKEGVARYTEYEVARTAAAHYFPSAGYRGLNDYTTFAAEADSALNQIIGEQENIELANWKRVAVYSSGAADALLLDEKRPGWKANYTRERFSLGGLFARPVR